MAQSGGLIAIDAGVRMNAESRYGSASDRIVASEVVGDIGIRRPMIFPALSVKRYRKRQARPAGNF
jgi:hypothetical protein